MGEEVGQLHQGGRVDVHEGAVHAGCPLTVQHLQRVLHNGARSSGSGRWGLMQWPGDRCRQLMGEEEARDTRDRWDARVHARTA